MSHLTEEGQKLYDAYINAKKAWTVYVEFHAKYAFNKKFNELGKKYYKYDYKYYIPKDEAAMMNDMKDNKKIQSAKTKKVYRKLSLLFHPNQ
jgi:hypothetical protein